MQTKNITTNFSRKPTENTFAYYPLTTSSQWNDMKPSWTKYNLTNTNVSFWTYQWVNCASFTSNTWLRYNWSYTLPNPITVSFRFYQTSIPSDTDWKQFMFYKDGASNTISFQAVKSTSNLRIGVGSSNVDIPINPTWKRCYANVSINSSWWTVDVRLNWNRSTYNVWWISSWSLQRIVLWNTITWLWFTRQYLWYLSEFIIESKLRTSSDKLSYYNKTKWKYWL